MLKQIIDFVKNKKREREAQYKTYPDEYCFFGSYDKEISEDGIDFSYSHNEYFLANDNHNPTQFKRLTGENCENSNPVIISKQKHNNNYNNMSSCTCIVEDNGIRYRIFVYPKKSSGVTTLRGLDLTTGNYNFENRVEAKQKAKAKLQINEEFSK